MIRRLVDVHYTTYRQTPTAERIEFWLRELRTPEFLAEAAATHRGALETEILHRPLLQSATRDDLESGALARALRAEEDVERDACAEHWQTLSRLPGRTLAPAGVGLETRLDCEDAGPSRCLARTLPRGIPVGYQLPLAPPPDDEPPPKDEPPPPPKPPPP